MSIQTINKCINIRNSNNKIAILTFCCFLFQILLSLVHSHDEDHISSVVLQQPPEALTSILAHLDGMVCQFLQVVKYELRTLHRERVTGGQYPLVTSVRQIPGFFAKMFEGFKVKGFWNSPLSFVRDWKGTLS